MVDPVLVGQQLLNGLLFGGILVIIAIGLSLIFGVGGVLNFSHGALFMVGGFIGLFTAQLTNSFLLAAAVATVGGFLMGLVIEVGFVRRIRDRDNLGIAAIMLTLGIAIAVENFMRVTQGSFHQSLPVSFGTDIWNIGPLIVTSRRVYIFVLAVAAIAALFAIIKYTKIGLGIRAVAQDRDTALLMGIRPNRIYAVTFAVSAALASLAGVLLAPLFSIYPSVGWRPFLLAFIVVMIGGLGSLRGTLVAAVVIALFRSVTLIWFSTQVTFILLFLFMIVVLYINPQGLKEVVEA
jgi:branched-chain amino acid transport system permease protein